MPDFAFPAGRWHGSWIWADVPPATAATRHTVALRTRLRLDHVPSVVPARMSALSLYALSVNGVEVARGPVRSNPRRQPYDDIDLAPHLTTGDNVIGAIVCHYDSATPWWMPPPMFGNDLVAGAFVFEARIGANGSDADDWLFTDGSWEALLLDGWTSTPGRGVSGRGREIVDARALPADWCTAIAAGAAGATWPPARVRRAITTGEPGRPQPPSYPGGPLGRRPISWPAITERTLTPTAGPTGGSQHVVLDRIAIGSLRLDFDAPAGSEVVVSTAEFLDASGAPVPSEHDASLSFVGDGTRRTLSSIDLFGARGAVIEVPDGATVHSLTIVERLHPVVGDHVFACSDPLLDEIWRVGRRTVSICSLDAYIDCPTREQRAWAGDSVVHQMVDLSTNSDWSLAHWHPNLTASPRADGMLPMAVAGDAEFYDFTVIPDWALHWVHSVWNLYRYAGDRDEIGRLLPVAEGVVRWFERFCDDAGMPRDVFGWVIIDWSAVYTEGASAALCGLWGRALTEFAEMAAWLGDNGRAGWATGTHGRLAEAVEQLWDPRQRRYVDSLADSTQRPMASQHGQAALIVGGLVPNDRLPRLVEVMTDEAHLIHVSFSAPGRPAEVNSDLTPGGAFLRSGHPPPWWDVQREVVRAQPFFRYVVHDALATAGRADLIPALCRDWAVALQRCRTSWVETWYGGTISHGWSSTPTRDMITRVLGVVPAEPGFGVARIDPNLGDLQWARGTAPTGHGADREPIRVEVDRARLVVDSPIPFLHRGTLHQPGHHVIDLLAQGSV